MDHVQHSTAPQYTGLLKRIQNSQHLLLMKNPENYFMLSNVAVCLNKCDILVKIIFKRVSLIFVPIRKTTIPCKNWKINRCYNAAMIASN